MNIRRICSLGVLVVGLIVWSSFPSTSNKSQAPSSGMLMAQGGAPVPPPPPPPSQA